MPLDLPELVARLGGAAKTVEMLEAGASPKMIAAVVRSRELLRPRKAWYVLPGTPPSLVAAVRVGGRATCLTALRELGVWVTDPVPLVHVAVHRSACQLRAVASHHERQAVIGDAVVHWVDTPRPRLAVGSRLLETPGRALADALGCLEGDALLATVESVLHRRLITPEIWRAMLAGMPSALRAELQIASALSGSGLETYFVSKIRRLGVPVRQQVWIGADRVDALLGECLVVELDGRAFHDPHTDHVRDARLILEGMRVLHFDYDMVLHDWATVEAVVLASLRRGDHLP
ncbi:DUF559 domain-containing protein [Pseudolysinimonas sp.]|uniref:endonuclease domain-containing protein n=1 Tax=Pseudolysinimonas sp. TaxID=2680009 RepID=UPI00286A8925|nr:DUF559 domain-containing protein [Pseudolysinimonas sp.]